VQVMQGGEVVEFVEIHTGWRIKSGT